MEERIKEENIFLKKIQKELAHLINIKAFAVLKSKVNHAFRNSLSSLDFEGEEFDKILAQIETKKELQSLYQILCFLQQNSKRHD